jgi:hypothetical protein
MRLERIAVGRGIEGRRGIEGKRGNTTYVFGNLTQERHIVYSLL